jgi:excisionase family DNA binding protein
MTVSHLEEFILVPKAYYNELIRKSESIPITKKSQMAEPKPETEYLTTEDLQQMLGVSRTTIKNWRDQKLLPYRKFGRKVLFTKDDVKKLERLKMGRKEQ